eukprot:c6457_g1_i1 orf=69-329(-)
MVAQHSTHHQITCTVASNISKWRTERSPHLFKSRTLSITIIKEPYILSQTSITTLQLFREVDKRHCRNINLKFSFLHSLNVADFEM